VQLRPFVACPRWSVLVLVAALVLTGCAGTKSGARGAGDALDPAGNAVAAAPGASSGAPSSSASASASASASKAAAQALPQAGNPNGKATVPAEAKAVDTSRPDRTVGTGTAASCTSEAVVAAVAAGGIITFDCGADPVTITLKATAKVRNTVQRVVIDGGGKVTLSGAGQRRILFMNTCDKAQGSIGGNCADQATPTLTVQNLTMANGNSNGARTDYDGGGGGGAVFQRGGRFKVINSRFVGNRCESTGPDVGGAALRVFDQSKDLPVYVVNSTFEGGVCSNGAGISSIHVSWVVLNSLFRNNQAVGKGANPARPGTPGGGSGGAIYCDGDRFTVTLNGTVIENNKANEGGGAIFFVSNDRTGTMSIENSRLKGNPSAGFETDGLPGIFFLGAKRPTTTGSTLSK
jgi:hypothetical protein